MSNIRSLSDLKKDSGRGNGGPGQGGNPGMPPMGGGGGGGMFGGLPGLGSLFGGMGGNAPQSHDEGKNIIHVHRDGQWREELVKAGGKLVVIDFTASWCGPCKMIAPHFKEMSEKYTNAVFLKIDVDECQETAQECGIRAMPTFQFYKNNKKVDEFSGASPDKLKAMIEKHIGGSSSGSSTSSSSGNFGGTGYVLGGKSSTSTQPTTSGPTPMQVDQSASVSADDEDVDPVMLTSLVEMGFPKEKAEKALRATKARDIEEAINWIVSHEDEAPKPSQTPSTAPSTTPAESAPSTSTSTAPAPVTTKSIKKLDPNDMVFDDDDEAAILAAQQAEENKPKRQLTPEEIAEEKRKLDERLKALRARKAEQEKQEEINRELMRRKEGQEAIESRKKWEDNQKQREAMLKQKEKDDEARYKEKLRLQLEQDKKERAARLGKTSAPTSSQSQSATPSAPATSQPPAKKEYTESAIQIRLPDGNIIKASFKPTDPIRTVHDHITLLTGSSNFSLATTFPRKVYSPRDGAMDSTTLAQAECVPTGTFVVQRM